MTSHLDRIDTSGQEEAAGRLARRIQREVRRRAERRRAIVLTVSAVVAGALLLAGGLSIASAKRGVPAVRAATQSARPTEAAVVRAAPAAVSAEPVAPLAAAESSAEAPPAPQVSAPSKPTPAKAARTKSPAHVPAKTRAAATARKRTPAQHLSIRIGTVGYEPSRLTASSAAPITLTVGKGEGCAAGFLMPSLHIEKDNSRRAVTFSLGKLKPGTYRFSCAMGMVEGQLVVR